jgi:hypothetical protein
VTIIAGETVTWTNDEQGVSHTVSSDTPGVFDSGALVPGATFRVTLANPGTYTYHCNFHPSMGGIVVVLAAGGAQEATPIPTAAAPTPTPTPAGPAPATATATPTAAGATGATATASPAAASPTGVPGSPPAGGTAAPSATPAPGAGDDDEDGPGTPLILAGLVALVVAVAIGGALLVRRR